jgi:hypothetical protein
MNNPTAIPHGIMPCPVCAVPMRIRFDQINRNVQCTECKFEFEATPYKAPVEVIRLSGACSFTKRPFVIALTRDAKLMRDGYPGVVVRDDLYRVAHVYEQRNAGVGQVQLIGSIPFSEVTNLSSFNCPFCLKHGVDFCNCGTWLCQGAAHQTPEGKRNYCPSCGPALFTLPITEVGIYSEPPMQRGAPTERRIGRLALQAATSLIRRSS